MMFWHKDTVFRFSILRNSDASPCLNGSSADDLSNLQRCRVNSDANESKPVLRPRSLPFLGPLRVDD